MDFRIKIYMNEKRISFLSLAHPLLGLPRPGDTLEGPKGEKYTVTEVVWRPTGGGYHKPVIFVEDANLEHMSEFEQKVLAKIPPDLPARERDLIIMGERYYNCYHDDNREERRGRNDEELFIVCKTCGAEVQWPTYGECEVDDCTWPNCLDEGCPGPLGDCEHPTWSFPPAAVVGTCLTPKHVGVSRLALKSVCGKDVILTASGPVCEDGHGGCDYEPKKEN